MGGNSTKEQPKKAPEREDPNRWRYGRESDYWFIIDQVSTRNITSAKFLYEEVVKQLPGLGADVIGATLEKDNSSHLVQATIYLTNYNSAKQASDILNVCVLGGCVINTNCVPPRSGNFVFSDYSEYAYTYKQQQRLLDEARNKKLKEEERLKEEKRLLELRQEQEAERLRQEQEQELLKKQEEERLEKEKERQEQELLELKRKNQSMKEQFYRELLEKEQKQAILEQQIREELEQNYNEKLEEELRKKELEKQQLIESMKNVQIQPIQVDVQKTSQVNVNEQEVELPRENNMDFGEIINDDSESSSELHIVQSNGVIASCNTVEDSQESNRNAESCPIQNFGSPNIDISHEKIPSCYVEKPQDVQEHERQAINTNKTSKKTNQRRKKAKSRAKQEDRCSLNPNVQDTGDGTQQKANCCKTDYENAENTVHTEDTIEYVFKFPEQKGETGGRSLPNYNGSVNDRVNSWLANQPSDTSDLESITNSSVKSDETASSVSSSFGKEQTWVVVSSLPNYVKGKQLYDLFSTKCEGVKRARRVKNKKGCGEVAFRTHEQMKVCVEKMDKTEQFGHKIRVRPKPLEVIQNGEDERSGEGKQTPAQGQQHNRKQEPGQNTQVFSHSMQDSLPLGQQQHPGQYRSQQYWPQFRPQHRPQQPQIDHLHGQMSYQQQYPCNQGFRQPYVQGLHQQYPSLLPRALLQQAPLLQRTPLLQQHSLLQPRPILQQDPLLQPRPVIQQGLQDASLQQRPPSRKPQNRRRRRRKKPGKGHCENGASAAAKNHDPGVKPANNGLEQDDGNGSSGSSLSGNEVYLGNNSPSGGTGFKTHEELSSSTPSI